MQTMYKRLAIDKVDKNKDEYAERTETPYNNDSNGSPTEQAPDTCGIKE